ncbi:MAG: hypothetical protein KUG74_10660, partial [Rhodobacteraceae bacterium]|nr:hypothetical protein [Paracoccaceae bacterium]
MTDVLLFAGNFSAQELNEVFIRLGLPKNWGQFLFRKVLRATIFFPIDLVPFFRNSIENTENFFQILIRVIRKRWFDPSYAAKFHGSSCSMSFCLCPLTMA